MKPANQAAILAHAHRDYPREACGLLVAVGNDERYFPCRNIAEDQKDFILAPEDFVAAEEQGRILAIVHSHCDRPARPSQADLAGCSLNGVPWVIVSVPSETWETIYPSEYKAPLIGREFSHGVHDCLAIVRDYYDLKLGIKLPDFERKEKWWEKGENLIIENFEKAGFYPVDGPLEVGDVILMQLMAKVVNHLAVYIGRDVMIHHLTDRLSRREVYGGYWKKNTHSVVRYRGKK